MYSKLEKFERNLFTSDMLSDGATYWIRKAENGMSYCIGVTRLNMMIRDSDVTIYIAFNEAEFNRRLEYVTEQNLVVLQYETEDPSAIFQILSDSTSSDVISNLEKAAIKIEKGVIIEH